MIATNSLQNDSMVRGKVKWKKIEYSKQSKAPYRRRMVGALVGDHFFVIFGKYNQDTNDVFRFDLKKKLWEKINVKSTQNPDRRNAASFATISNSIYIFGGFGANKFRDDFYRFDTDTLKWKKLNPKGENPLGRYGSTLCEIKGDLYLFGGWSILGKMNDFYRYSVSEDRWSRIIPEGLSPTQRCYHTAVVFRDDLYVFGGSTDHGKLNDMYRYSVDKNQWNLVEYKNSKINEIPLPVRNHSAEVHANSLIVFGGQCDGTGISNRLFEFHFDEGRWQKISTTYKPKKRRSHVSFISNKSLVVFGGCNEHTLADMYCLDIFLRSWCPKSHCFYLHNNSFCSVVVCLLLLHRFSHSVVSSLPKQVLFLVLRQLSKMLNIKA